MNDRILVTTEILLTIVLPLLVLYLKGPWSPRETIVCMVTIPVLWYPLYAPIHESSHLLGDYLVGARVTEIKLIPRFWLGEFARAWINAEGFTHGWQRLISTGAPYILDFACVAATILLVRKHFPSTAFLAGFTFMLLCLRPLFDLVCETVAFAMGGRGDVYFIGRILGRFVTWIFFLCSIGLAILGIARVLRVYRADPSSLCSKG
jgi:hypothetical protein